MFNLSDSPLQVTLIKFNFKCMYVSIYFSVAKMCIVFWGFEVVIYLKSYIPIFNLFLVHNNHLNFCVSVGISQWLSIRAGIELCWISKKRLKFLWRNGWIFYCTYVLYTVFYGIISLILIFYLCNVQLYHV